MYGDWVKGVPVEPGFLAYGFKPAAGSTQSVILTTLRQVSQQFPTIGGAFIGVWRFINVWQGHFKRESQPV